MSVNARRMSDAILSAVKTPHVRVQFGDVKSVNSGGKPSVDVESSGDFYSSVPVLESTSDVRIGDRVVLLCSGGIAVVIGVVKLTWDTSPYVISNFLNGFRAYSSSQAPTLFRQGHIVVMEGAFGMDGHPDAGYSLSMATIPVGYRPVRQVNSLQQASQQYRHLLTVSETGYVGSSRYGTTDSQVQPKDNAWYNAYATWWTDDPMPD